MNQRRSLNCPQNNFQAKINHKFQKQYNQAENCFFFILIFAARILAEKVTCSLKYKWKRTKCPGLKGLIRAKIYPRNALVDEQWELLFPLLNGKKGLIQVCTANFLPKTLILLEELLFVQTNDFCLMIWPFFRKDFVIYWIILCPKCSANPITVTPIWKWEFWKWGAPH